MSGERWKEIPGYEGIYYISDLGRVYSHYSQKCLKPLTTHAGYHRVHLCKDGKTFNASIHRLVATAFIPNPESKPTVNHINEIKTDNRSENLEWATNSEQNIHGTRIKRVVAHTDYKARNIDYSSVAAKHDYFNMNKAQMRSVLLFDKDEIFIAKFDSLSQAACSFGVSKSSMYRYLNGERRCRGGYKWKYA